MTNELPEHALFVYGSLSPQGGARELLEKVEGKFIKAHIQARFSADGWGHTENHPAVILDEKADKVEGYLFLSNELGQIIHLVDAYEREEYQRVRYHATTEDGDLIACQVYELAEHLKPETEEPSHIGI